MDTSVFLTRTEFRPMKNPSNGKDFIGGIDLGYSSTKGFCPGAVYCVPNLSREIRGDIVGNLKDTDIVYIDERDRKYYIGDLALKVMRQGENVTEAAIYGRNHYMTPEFLIQARVAIALSVWDQKVFPENYFFQGGLPPAYITEDEVYLRNVLEGRHTFSIIKGTEKKDFDFTLHSDRIGIMKQAMGTFTSICAGPDCGYTSDLVKYLNSNTLVFDGGFKTLDIYFVKGGQVELCASEDKLGLSRVLEESREMMFKEHPDIKITISIPEMQNILKTGQYNHFNKITMCDRNINMAPYIEAANKIVREEAFDYIKDVLGDTEYLVMAGGTGAAWNYYFADKLKNVSRIKIIPGNTNSGLPYIYSNARGYFVQRYNS